MSTVESRKAYGDGSWRGLAAFLALQGARGRGGESMREGLRHIDFRRRQRGEEVSSEYPPLVIWRARSASSVRSSRWRLLRCSRSYFSDSSRYSHCQISFAFSSSCACDSPARAPHAFHCTALLLQTNVDKGRGSAANRPS